MTIGGKLSSGKRLGQDEMYDNARIRRAIFVVRESDYILFI